MKKKKIFKVLCGIFLGVACILLIGINLLYHMDTLTLWSIIPGINSSKEVRESGLYMVLMAEELPEEENAWNMVASMTMFGAVVYAAEEVQNGEIDDQVMRQYTLGLVKGAMLEDRGGLSALEYQLFKLPFKTGNTKIMEKMLPALQKRTQLPEGFMSEEYVKEQQKED